MTFSFCPACGVPEGFKHNADCMFHGRASVSIANADPVDDKPGGSTPSQYAIPRGARELQDLIEHREMNFAVGNIFKAAYRMGVKHETAEYDLRKIIWFARRELKRQGFEE